MSTPTRNQNSLIGKWSLKAYENFQLSGSSILITEGQSGSLEYTIDGRVRLSIRRDQHQLNSLGLNSRLANIEYFGRYEVDEATQSVFHHIEEANDPTRIGKTLLRNYHFNNDQLEIVGTGFDGRVKLTWSRVL
ncbi:MAG: lipocalin-like domain-containing protein [Pseudobdellovibrionaceae bacterium]